jgi:hypothetical protein
MGEPLPGEDQDRSEALAAAGSTHPHRGASKALSIPKSRHWWIPSLIG